MCCEADIVEQQACLRIHLSFAAVQTYSSESFELITIEIPKSSSEKLYKSSRVLVHPLHVKI
ncbi:hypothetical protein ACU8KH_00529 [Lachancea thermotolerans]